MRPVGIAALLEPEVTSVEPALGPVYGVVVVAPESPVAASSAGRWASLAHAASDSTAAASEILRKVFTGFLLF